MWGGVLAVGSVLNVALAAFFDAGFYGYISNVLVKGEQGSWGVLWGEGIKHWRVMVGWSARRLWWRGVLGVLVFVLGSALLNAGAAGAEGGSVGGGGGKIAGLWALAALCLGALGFGVWMWRVRTAKRMLEGERTTWAGQRAAAGDVLRYKAAMLGGFGAACGGDVAGFCAARVVGGAGGAGAVGVAKRGVCDGVDVGFGVGGVGGVGGCVGVGDVDVEEGGGQ